MDGAEGGYRVQEINTHEEFKGLLAEDRPVDWRLAEGGQGSPRLRRLLEDLLATMRGVVYCGPEEMQWRGGGGPLAGEGLCVLVGRISAARVAAGTAAGL